MKKINNISIPNSTQDILADMYYQEQNNGVLVLFCHGFKGFKDWGAWHLVAEQFAKAGFIFVAFNFSHNGIGHQDLHHFSRLDLFRENNYSKEMADTKTIIEWLHSDSFKASTALDFKEMNIIGHSRGGGIALLTAFENDKINKVVTWASIANFDRFGNENDLEQWQKKGTKNFHNSRTKQDMEIGYQFYEDFDNNRKRFDLEYVCKNLKKPLLIIHGKEDDAVGFSHAQRIKNWKTDATLFLIEKGNHVFGAKHPYNEEKLHSALSLVVDKTIAFFS